MTRPQRIRTFLSRKGFRLLLLELVIVFLGVYGAFALQSWSEGVPSEPNGRGCSSA